MKIVIIIIITVNIFRDLIKSPESKHTNVEFSKIPRKRLIQSR